jgi:uncharacterized iron-regulated membrane protein
MNRWLRQLQQVVLRKVLFQIHLWLGLALGVYVVILSVSGSLLVYRIELTRELGTPPCA